ncbi:hypothetical protein, conserved [Plasmodium gonderi]|uniref:Trimethylguanosine synthase n=1 Tax=Plasmodium gonderi TaxID=77519 RepID=A0A1Y1JKD8_PLAGO|nr:hypothetical protein, conserved [Plasmodium gonderi]GAW82760.1 hypothetical protein, conserved [Plasmodium gonderi]
MIRKTYKNYNDQGDNDKTSNLSFLVHSNYYSVLDLDEEDLVNNEIRHNFLQLSKKINIYDKSEPIKNYKKKDALARELNYIKSWELLKKTYKYKMPIIYQNFHKFNLYKRELINYFPTNYYARKRNLVRRKKMASVYKDNCFIIDNEMIYSMTPEYISKNIGKSIMPIKKKKKRKYPRKPRIRKDREMAMGERKKRRYNENVHVTEEPGGFGDEEEFNGENDDEDVGDRITEVAEVIEEEEEDEEEEEKEEEKEEKEMVKKEVEKKEVEEVEKKEVEEVEKKEEEEVEKEEKESRILVEKIVKAIGVEEIDRQVPSSTSNVSNKANSENVLIYLDPFAGAGGNSQSMSHVFTIASDVELARIKECQHNCKFYNNNVDFILCDFFNIVNSFRENTIDVIFLSIPWGGPSYKEKKQFQLNDPKDKLSVYSCLKESTKLTKNIIIYLPRNVCMVDLYHLFRYYQKLVNGKNKLKKQSTANDVFIELYINRVRCTMKEEYDNSAQNFYYFFNQQSDMPSNEFDIAKQANLFNINIDQCNQFLKHTKERKKKKITTTKNIEDIYKINIKEENDMKKQGKEKKMKRGNTTDDELAKDSKSNKKIKTLWKWHNTCMVVYLGKITNALKKNKTINYNSIYYLHNEISRCNMRKVKNRGHTNFSLYRQLCNKKKNAFHNITRRVERREICISKNERAHKIFMNDRNIFFLNYFIDKKLSELMSIIRDLFFKNVKNILGFEKVSFLNKVFIHMDNSIFRALTRKLTIGKNVKKYETYIYSDMLGKNTGLHIITGYLNTVLRKVNKVIILLFGIYLHDISFMKYFFKFYKVKVSTSELKNKKSFKNIHYNIIRLLFKFILYIDIFKNVLSNNIKMEEFFSKNILNEGLANFLEFLDIANNDYNFIKYKNKKDFSISFKNFIKNITHLSVNIELNGKKIRTEYITNMYFQLLFNVYDPNVLLDEIQNSPYEDLEQIKCYQWHLCLCTINFFTQQFFYNTNITSFLDYFNSLIYFYFNQMYFLSKSHHIYSNLFIVRLNSFLYDNFCIQIL